MGLTEYQKNVTATVAIDTYKKIARLAERNGVSVSKMTGMMLEGLASERREIERVQSVRRGGSGDELMVSLPMAWCRMHGVEKGSRVRVDYSNGIMQIVPESGI